MLHFSPGKTQETQEASLPIREREDFSQPTTSCRVGAEQRLTGKGQDRPQTPGEDNSWSASFRWKELDAQLVSPLRLLV